MKNKKTKEFKMPASGESFLTEVINAQSAEFVPAPLKNTEEQLLKGPAFDIIPDLKGKRYQK